jgi:phage terminase large subunit-like protein
MGRRGINAKPKPAQASAAFRHPHPWELPGLSRAEKVITFCETLPVTAGPLAGTLLKLRPWQRRFIRRVYRTDRTGNRLVRTAVLSTPRKNGKTQLAAALALAHFVGPESEQRGECYAVACTRFQAARVFNEMVAIITRAPWLDERINIIRFRKELEDDVTGSIFAVLAADVAPVHGLSPSFVCYDELAQVPSRALYDALGTALGARASPLMVVISTQAPSDTAPMSELVDYGLRCQRGELVDPHFHLTLYTAPVEMDPWSPKTWRKANPALGDFRSLEDVKRLAAQAQRMPSAEQSFKHLILNQRIDTMEHFIAPSVWKACATTSLPKLKGRRCWGGLDLGATRDLTALVLVFADDVGGYDLLCRVWLPGDIQEAEDRDRAPYSLWIRQGHLLTFPGRSSTDPKAVAVEIARLHGEYHLEGLAFDRWRITDLQRELDDIGCDVKLIEFGQGYKDMAAPVDLVERLIVERNLRHTNNPALTMALMNCKVELDPAGNRKLSKRRSTGRIDPAVALTMAIGITTAKQEREPSYQMFVI